MPTETPRHTTSVSSKLSAALPGYQRHFSEKRPVQRATRPSADIHKLSFHSKARERESLETPSAIVDDNRSAPFRCLRSNSTPGSLIPLRTTYPVLHASSEQSQLSSHMVDESRNACTRQTDKRTGAIRQANAVRNDQSTWTTLWTPKLAEGQWLHSRPWPEAFILGAMSSLIHTVASQHNVRAVCQSN